MSKPKLYIMLALLKAYRAHLCFEGDSYEQHASKMIHDVRFAIQHGGFYHLERKLCTTP